LSEQSIKRRELARYENRTEVQLLELRWDLLNGAPPRALKCRVELIEELVEKTGGTLATLAYRERLAELKKKVVLREHQLRRSRGHLKAVKS
jgi:hypothetical protein